MGKKTKKAVARITNSSAPAAQGTEIKGARTPKVQYQTDGGCRIKHMEFVSDVVGASTAVTQSYAINPQRSSVFVWLSAVATRFEMFKFNSLKFVYKPSCSTTTSGWVAMGFDFDYYDSAPTKSTLLTWKYSAKTVPWKETALDVSQDSRLQTERYNNYEAGSGDSRLDFLGNLWLLVAPLGGTTEIGELFVMYDITFRQPAYKIPPSLYASFEGPVSTTEDYTVSPISNLSGNMQIAVKGPQKFAINEVGRFLVTAWNSGTGLNAVPIMNFQTVNPGQGYEESFVEQFINSTGTLAGIQKILDVTEAPMVVEILQDFSGTSHLHTLVSTFAARNPFS